MADKIDIPERASAPYTPWNPRVTVLGTIATTVVYMLSLTVVFGIVPTPGLAAPPGPGVPRGREHDHAR